MSEDYRTKSGTQSAWVRRRLAPAGRLDYAPQFLPRSVADRLLLALSGEVDWAQRPIVMFGRRVLQPRLTAFHGDAGVAYRYSGKTLSAKGWTPALGELRDWLRKRLGQDFNCVLCNLYRDGRDAMGWHADNEPELGLEPLIASISLGAPRRFQLKPRSANGERVELVLEHGSLLVMSGDLQQHWLHQLPRALKIGEPRINLTFRQITDLSSQAG
jgi:alkylated DNA repair dioxygenase AlkB